LRSRAVWSTPLATLRQLHFRAPSKTSLCCGAPLLNLACFQVGQSSCFGFRFTSRSLAPVKRAFLHDVDVTDEEQTDEDHHLEVNKRPHFRTLRREGFEHCCPRHEEDHFYVEQDEDHRDQVELHGESF